MKILITGIAGLLGSHLSRYFLIKGHTIIGIDYLSGGYEEFVPTTLDITFYKRTIGKDSISDIFVFTITYCSVLSHFTRTLYKVLQVFRMNM
jgi:nucleoside-diphosphate-sugar epimerase